MKKVLLFVLLLILPTLAISQVGVGPTLHAEGITSDGDTVLIIIPLMIFDIFLPDEAGGADIGAELLYFGDAWVDSIFADFFGGMSDFTIGKTGDNALIGADTTFITGGKILAIVDQSGNDTTYIHDDGSNLLITPDNSISIGASVAVTGTVSGTTYGSDGSISDAELLTLDNGATTEVLVGGGAGSAPVWTTATGTGAPVRAGGSPVFSSNVTIETAGGATRALKLNSTSSYIGFQVNAPTNQNTFFEMTENSTKVGGFDINSGTNVFYVGGYARHTLRLGSSTGSGQTNLMSLDSAKIIINDGSGDIDWRHESDNADSAFVVNGSDGHIFMEGLGSGTGTNLSRVANTDQIVLETSSKRYKDNIKPWQIDISVLMGLKPSTFVWNDKSAVPGKKGYGLIAENIAETFPEAAQYSNGLVNSWDTKAVIAYLVGVIQQQEKRIEALEGKK